MSKEDLNMLYGLMRQHRLSRPDLERDIAQKLPHLPPASVRGLLAEINETVAEIEDYICTQVDPQRPSDIPKDELLEWIRDSYAWMDEESVQGAYHHGLQFAFT